MDAHDEFRFLRCIELLATSGCTLDSTSRWLDLGCHQGQLLQLLIDRFGIIQPIGSDDWPNSLREGQEFRWDYIQADFERGLPQTEPMDVISALEVIEHIIDTDRFLSEVYDRLKPGGWLLLSTPNINSLRNRVTVPFGAYPTGLEYRNIIHHVRLYNPHVLATHLGSKGFSEIRMCGISFLPMRFLAFGRSKLSRKLADRLPQLCNNFVAVARKPTPPEGHVIPANESFHPSSRKPSPKGETIRDLGETSLMRSRPMGPLGIVRLRRAMLRPG